MVTPIKYSLIFLFSIFLLACATEDDVDPCETAPKIRAQMETELEENEYWNPNLEDALSSKVIPGGFGGIYYPNGDHITLTMVLVDISKSKQAIQALSDAQACKALYEGEIEFETIEIQQGKYDAAQLLLWRKEAEIIAYGDADTHSSAIDTFTNRVWFGVATAEGKERVTQLLIDGGIPADAIFIEVEDPPMFH